MLKKVLLSMFFVGFFVACGENVVGPTTTQISDSPLSINPAEVYMEVGGDPVVFSVDGGTGTYDFVITDPQRELFEVSYPNKKQIRIKLVQQPYPFIKAFLIIYSGSQKNSAVINFYR